MLDTGTRPRQRCPLVLSNASDTTMTTETIECESCGKELRDTENARKEMKVHENECNWTDDPRERFEVGDRVQYSDFGKFRLDKDDREGEVVGFSRKNENLVRVRWDGNKTACRYAHSFIKHTLTHRINEEMVVSTETNGESA